ncbi:MAG TPA: ribbon-helix-helix protein, CopG family [Methanosarcinales archaeon]|nr:ribbon-helix-helix protein, CopG family [Methanosarcinales archaeon]
MKGTTEKEKTRINIQIPSNLKARLRKISKRERMNMTTFVRKSIEERLSVLERAEFEAKMKEAYLELAQENLAISEDFKFVEGENLD